MSNGWMWILFNVFVLAMLALDLGVFHRRARIVAFREAMFTSATWIVISLLFTGLVVAWQGPEAGWEFVTAYVLEKSLSLDNLFVFSLIFTSLNVPEKHQHKVLFYGLLGAIVFRALFIVVGVTLFVRFAWVHYVFGALLVVTGVRAFGERQREIGKNPAILRFAQKLFPVSTDENVSTFFVRDKGRIFATPLFLVLLLVESTDLVFAVDSVPAVLGVTSNLFIAYSSNILALLGLRSLYFLLAHAIPRFRYLRVGLSVVLVFVGVKMLLVHIVRIPVVIALGVICLILTGTIVASLRATKRPPTKV